MFYLLRYNSFLVSVDIAIYFDSVFVEKKPLLRGFSQVLCYINGVNRSIFWPQM